MCPVDCVCIENVGSELPVRDLDLGLVVPGFLPITSNVLVFIIPETYMSVYSQINSHLCLGLCRYEGLWVEMFVP